MKTKQRTNNSESLGVDRQPASLNELKVLVDEFTSRARSIENEMELLKQDMTELVDEFSNKLDMKTLKAALRAAKIREKVSYKDTFDTFLSILEGEPQNDTNNV